MKNIFYIFIGGGAGSVLRYWISSFTAHWFSVGLFPLGTFLVNLLGCFLFGLGSGWLLKDDAPLKYLFLVGFCGGFTTFSAFSSENFHLWQNGNWGMLAAYTVLSAAAGILSVMAGYSLWKG